MKKTFFRYILTLQLAAVLSVFIASCSSFVRSDSLQMMNAARTAITNSFPVRFPVTVYHFTNRSTVRDSDYLSRAIPEMIAAMLRPMQGETTFVDFRRFPVTMPKAFKKIALASNTIFMDYVTNIHTVVTQFTYRYVTNSNYMRVIYATNVSDTNRTVKAYVIQTNIVSTNVRETNRAEIPESFYLTIITNMFPEVTNLLSSIPIRIEKNFLSNYQPTNMRPFTAAIYGSFTTTPSSRGPSSVTVNLTLVKFLEAIDTNTNRYIRSSNSVVRIGTNGATNRVMQPVVVTNRYSNRLTLTLKCREDELVYKLNDWLGPIRRMLLATSVGDLQINSEPAGASIYLDGTFIGKTPLFYPSVPQGTHQLSFMKNGYERLVIKADVQASMTNVLNVLVQMKESGGVITVSNRNSNELVFLDNSFRGATPLVISNLSLGEVHRMQVISSNTNLKPFYTTFRLYDPGEQLMIRPVYRDFYGSPENVRRAAWWSAYGGWFLTAGILGFNIYSHYMENYYRDLTMVYPADPSYTTYLNSWQSRRETSFTVGIISAVLATGLTANALYRDEIYLGLWLNPAGESRAVVGIRY